MNIMPSSTLKPATATGDGANLAVTSWLHIIPDFTTVVLRFVVSFGVLS